MNTQKIILLIVVLLLVVVLSIFLATQVYKARSAKPERKLDMQIEEQETLLTHTQGVIGESKLASLIGNPAPGFQQIKGWLNSHALTLADLRGKVVLLDFWSTKSRDAICCELARLQTKYRANGLVVIVIFGDRVASIREMKEELHDIPVSWEFMERKIGKFVIALDGGGPTPIEGTAWKVPGATTAAYGIRFCPTTLLVDREGRIAKVISLDIKHPEAVEREIKNVLGLIRDKWTGKKTSIEPDSLVLRLVDPTGHPVVGAKVGSWTVWQDMTRAPSPAFNVGFGDKFREGPRSNSDGLVALPGTHLFAPSVQGAKLIAIYGLDQVKLFSGLIEISRLDLSREREMVLRPACHIHGKLICKQKLASYDVRLYWGGHYVASHTSYRPFFEFYVPPGQYTLTVGAGSNTPKVDRPIVVESGVRELKVDVTLPISRLAILIGKPAPELRGIKEWKNGGPVKLADLRGKIVLLDFWSYWCGPCLADMPKLMELHETYKDDGLVIIGIHDATVSSIEEMEDKLKIPREKFWGGRDIPFIVALDGGDTEKAYGITSWPTKLLIDSEGKLLGRFQDTKQDKEKLEELLGIEKATAQIEGENH